MMEASVAAQQGGQGEGEGVDTTTGGTDFAALAEQLGAMQSTQEDMRTFLQSAPWQSPADGGQGAAEAAAQGAGEELDLSFLDIDAPEFDPGAMAGRLNDLIERTVEARTTRAIEEHVLPLRDAQEEARIKAEATDLVTEFPEMGDPDVAKKVVQVAAQMAQAHGRPELAGEPWFWRMTYMAGRAADAANAEGREGQQAATLEGGTGARPGPSPDELGDMITGGRQGRRALPFG